VNLTGFDEWFRDWTAPKAHRGKRLLVPLSSPESDSSTQNGASGITPIQSGPEPGEELVPRWDGDRRKLWFDSRLCKRYTGNPAKNQIDVIEAFDAAGWPATVPDPFRDPRKLNVTIRSLNDAMAPGTIRFRGDGTGEGVIWEAALA